MCPWCPALLHIKHIKPIFEGNGNGKRKGGADRKGEGERRAGKGNETGKGKGDRKEREREKRRKREDKRKGRKGNPLTHPTNESRISFQLNGTMPNN